MDERVVRARELYEQAIFNGTDGVLTQADTELDAVEADLALARGRVLHGRFVACGKEDPAELPLFQRSAELYRNLGDRRGEAEALFWIGCFYQVVWNDPDGAAEALEQSADLAERWGTSSPCPTPFATSASSRIRPAASTPPAANSRSRPPYAANSASSPA